GDADRTRHGPGGALVPRALGRDTARHRGDAGRRRVLRLRPDGRAGGGAVAALLPPQDAEDGGGGAGPQGRALGVLLAEPGRAGRDGGLRGTGEAGGGEQRVRLRV
ncbi:MAG: Arsenical resistance operon repressor, partial [uncultured Gemmatimonadetes bacterium]